MLSSLNNARTFKVVGSWYKPHFNHEGHVEGYVYSYFEKGCRKKVHATIPKGIVGDFEFTVFQRSLKE